MEAEALENYFKLHGYNAYAEAEGVVKAFCGTTRITEISESRFQQTLTDRQLADEAAVAQAAEAEKEAAEEEEEEDEENDGADGGNDDHHPNDDDMHEGGGAMIIPSNESEGEHSGAESVEAAPKGEAPSPASSTGSGNQELAIVPFINPVTTPRRTKLVITPELAELLVENAPVRVWKSQMEPRWSWRLQFQWLNHQ